MSDDPARSSHDLGGLPAGPVDTTDHGMEFWERQANALRMVVRRSGVCRSDELRRAAESLGDRYREMAYFERTTAALRTVLVEKGVLADDEIDAKADEVRARYDAARDTSSSSDRDVTA